MNLTESRQPAWNLPTPAQFADCPALLPAVLDLLPAAYLLHGDSFVYVRKGNSAKSFS